ncbi:hypothetical protein D3C85_1122260 [compost metagenome]
MRQGLGALLGGGGRLDDGFEVLLAVSVQLGQRGDGLVHAFAEGLGARSLDVLCLGLGLGGALFDGLLNSLGGVSHWDSPEAIKGLATNGVHRDRAHMVHVRSDFK